MHFVLIETTSEHYRQNPFSQMDRLLEPLGVECIGAWLVMHGHDVEVWHQLTQSHGDLLHKLAATEPDIVGLSCMTYAYPDTRDLAMAIKVALPECQIVLGGYHVLGMETAPSCFDFVVNGEGELAMSAIADVIAGRAALTTVPGLRFCRGRPLSNPMARVDPSSLPAALRLPRLPYRSLSIGENTAETILACISAGRGCPYRCDFCATPQLFPGDRLYRQAAAVVDEMERLQSELGANNFNLRDETFVPRKQRASAVAFCDEIIRRRLHVSFRIFANAGDIDDELMAMLAEAGCHMIFYGIEAFERSVLKARRKNFQDSERMVADIRRAQRYGIFVRGGYIVGHETDTVESFDQHAAFLKHALPDELYVGWLTPFAGTPLFDRVKHRLLTTDERLFDCEHPIVDIGIPVGGMEPLREKVYRDFYASQEWRRHMLSRARIQPERAESIRRFCEFTTEKHCPANMFDFARTSENA